MWSKSTHQLLPKLLGQQHTQAQHPRFQAQPIDEDDTNDIGVGSEYRFGIVESRSAQESHVLSKVYMDAGQEKTVAEPYVAPSGQSITNKCHIVSIAIESDEQPSIEEELEYSLSLAPISISLISLHQPPLPSPRTEKYEFRVVIWKMWKQENAGLGVSIHPTLMIRTATTLLSKTYHNVQIFSYLNNPNQTFFRQHNIFGFLFQKK